MRSSIKASYKSLGIKNNDNGPQWDPRLLSIRTAYYMLYILSLMSIEIIATFSTSQASIISNAKCGISKTLLAIPVLLIWKWMLKHDLDSSVPGNFTRF